MNQNPMTFDVSKAEQAGWLANMLAEFQAKGVKFIVEKDSNLVYITVL